MFAVVVGAWSLRPAHAQTDPAECERQFLGQQLVTADTGRCETIFAADLDSDGDADVLCASGWDDKVVWYENVDGQGTFSLRRIIVRGVREVYYVLAADLDGDDDMDVVFSAGWDDEIAWLENTDGHGTFGPQQTIITNAGGVSFILTADMDTDGDLDVLAVLSRYPSAVVWYENSDGEGNFGAARQVSTDPSISGPVSAADLDGDGDIDVVARSYGIKWYPNYDGLGRFGSARNIAATGLRSMAVADLDRDGDVDILGVHGQTDRIVWYENRDGLGNFGAPRDVSTDEAYSSSVFAADLDGDGDIDVLGIPSGDSSIAWYPNTDGFGTFGPQRRIENSYDFRPQFVTAVDLDGDFDPDVLAKDSSGATIVWYANEADCNENGVNDGCDLADGRSGDCNANGRPDECEPDCNFNGLPDTCETDCNCNGIDDDAEIDAGSVDDCNANRIPDECELADGAADCQPDGILDECQNDCNCNGVDDAVDIDSGTSGDCNADGLPDGCAGPALAVFVPPLKSRYLSLASIGMPGVRLAIRVTFVDNDSYPELDGQSLWVGPPQAYPEEDANDPDRTFVGADLSCTPYYHDWSTIDTLHVFGAEIVPRSTYAIQLTDERCFEMVEQTFSELVLARTGSWGDVGPLHADPSSPWQPDMTDIAHSVQKYLGADYILKAQAQLQPNVVLPDRPVDFKDIATVIAAFVGTPYVDSVNDAGPCTCPSAVTCGARSCVGDSVCAPGFCIDGFCTDKCGRCEPRQNWSNRHARKNTAQ